MAVKLNSTGGGSVTLDSPSTASNYTVTLPSAAGTLATTTGTGSVFTNPTINGFTGDTSAITIGTTQFVKDASGNIGIGTGTPLAKLSVGAGSLSDANVPIQISSASSAATWVGFNKAGAYGGLIGFSNAFSGLTIGLTIRSVTTDPIVFTVNNTLEAMYLNASGNLGLGVTPSAWGSYWKVIEGYGAVSLAVISNSVNPVEIGNNYYSVNSGFTSYYKSNGRATKYTCGDSGQHIWYNSNNVSGTAGAAWTPTQIMTLDASGNLGIGTSSVTANHRFTLKAPTSNYCQMSLIGGDTSNYCTLGTLNDSNVFFISQNGTERARIDSSGVFKINNLAGSGSRAVNADASGNLSAASDSSLKQEDKGVPLPGLKEILKITPRAYKWLADIENRGDDAATEIGFFADEVAPIIPSAAPKCADGLYGFYDRSVTAALVKAIQELSAQNNALEARLAQLEAK